MTAKMKSLVKGILAGLAGKPLEFAKGEPVAYLFNGATLHALPKEWNEKTHPYAWIEFVGFGVYGFYYSQTPLYATGGTYYEKDEVKCQPPVIAYQGSYQLNPWERNENWDATTEDYTNGIGWISESGNQTGVIWANHNVVSDDGKVYLAASEPVPVYE